MNIKMKIPKAKSVFGECCVLALIVIVVWGITGACKHIYPFGTYMMDCGDMAEENVPMYIHLWDFMHGQKSFFFDWYTGLGNNMSGSIWHFGLISPFNIFFLFVKRSGIEASMWFFLLIKLIGAAFSMRFLLEKWFPQIRGSFRVSFCLLYVFSAFNMQYFNMQPWMDIVFMFPLVIYYFFLLMNEKKEIGYIVCLAIFSMIGFQHTYMLVLMLFLLTGTLLLLDKEKYVASLWVLLRASVISAFLSAYIWVPGILQIMGAKRLENSHSLITIWNSIWVFYPDKWMKLMNMGIPLSFFLIYFVKQKFKKENVFFLSIFAYLCAPIILESTNLLWHGGTYQSYPMRFSYMLTFWMIIGGAYGYSKIMESKDAGRQPYKVVNIFSVMIMCCLMLASVGTQHYFLLQGISAGKIILIVAITTLLSYMMFKLKWGGYDKVILGFVILQSLVLTYNFVDTSWSEKEGFIWISGSAWKNEITEPEKPLERIKSMSIFLSHNYPLVMAKSAISNYTASESAEQILGILNLGYARVGFRMSDYGGTLFSDALLGMKEAISPKEQSKELYSYRVSYDPYHIYDCNYTYDGGILLKDAFRNVKLDDEDPFALQNRIAQVVLGKEIFNINKMQDENLNVDIGKESILYLYIPAGTDIASIVVTNQSNMEEHTFTLHESGWENGILNLGIYKDAYLDVRLNSGTDLDNIYCATLELADFQSLSPKYADGFHYTATSHAMNIEVSGAEKGEYLFLPIYADEGWECRVNNKHVNINKFAGGCMVIPLEEGNNDIKLNFSPKGLKMGVIVSLFGIALFVCVIRKKGWQFEKLNGILYVVVIALFAVLLLVFYVIPAICLIKYLL